MQIQNKDILDIFTKLQIGFIAVKVKSKDILGLKITQITKVEQNTEEGTDAKAKIIEQYGEEYVEEYYSSLKHRYIYFNADKQKKNELLKN